MAAPMRPSPTKPIPLGADGRIFDPDFFLARDVSSLALQEAPGKLVSSLDTRHLLKRVDVAFYCSAPDWYRIEPRRLGPLFLLAA